MYRVQIDDLMMGRLLLMIQAFLKEDAKYV